MWKYLALLVIAATACGEELPEKGELIGGSLAKALQEDMSAAAGLEAPYRCASSWSPPALPSPMGPWSFVAEGDALIQARSKGDDGELSVLLLSDMRSFERGDLEGVDELVAQVAKSKVDLIVSLGGHDTAHLDYKAFLASLSLPGALTWALPGDREDVGLHRRITAELRDEGLPIIDGSRHRALNLEGWLLAAVPGIEAKGNLVAGTKGCRHRAEDLAPLAQLLDSRAPRSALLFSYAPPRQGGPSGSDLGVGGAHTGEQALAELGNRESVLAVVHGMLAPPPDAPSSGRINTSGKGLAPGPLATGSLDGLEPPIQALHLRIKGPRMTWKRLSAGAN